MPSHTVSHPVRVAPSGTQGGRHQRQGAGGPPGRGEARHPPQTQPEGPGGHPRQRALPAGAGDGRGPGRGAGRRLRRRLPQGGQDSGAPPGHQQAVNPATPPTPWLHDPDCKH